MQETEILERQEGMKKRFPARQLIPFARRYDNDDVACFDFTKEEIVYVIHDFATIGYEQRKTFESFWDWFKLAVDEMVEFQKMDISIDK
jgi:hypothetical protein